MEAERLRAAKELEDFTAPRLLGPASGAERMYAVASKQALIRKGPGADHMAVGCLRLGMRFLARKEGSWLRLCPQHVAPPLASPSAAGLLVNAEESLWVEAVEPTLRPVLEAQRNFVAGEELQVLVAEPGDFFGHWISAEIASDGDWPSMYHILVKAGTLTMRRENVPMWYLRKPDEDDWH
ncbi:unnamed protein product [Symbiodinium sp. CCMP2592]|nr:unnamed protein product [Symbiodinium sp. CCMP2592]